MVMMFFSSSMTLGEILGDKSEIPLVKPRQTLGVAILLAPIFFRNVTSLEIAGFLSLVGTQKSRRKCKHL
jgi:hypothetical protein